MFTFLQTKQFYSSLALKMCVRVHAGSDTGMEHSDSGMVPLLFGFFIVNSNFPDKHMIVFAKQTLGSTLCLLGEITLES